MATLLKSVCVLSSSILVKAFASTNPKWTPATGYSQVQFKVKGDDQAYQVLTSVESGKITGKTSATKGYGWDVNLFNGWAGQATKDVVMTDDQKEALAKQLTEAFKIGGLKDMKAGTMTPHTNDSTEELVGEKADQQELALA